jgi:hypothetical protein
MRAEEAAQPAAAAEGSRLRTLNALSCATIASPDVLTARGIDAVEHLGHEVDERAGTR